MWYDYATKHSSLIIDDYDSMFDDLLPFWSLSPSELRKRTWKIVSNPWNEISGISIRNGHAEIQENVLPTHRWMLEGVAEMVNKFAEHLPDMDMAFNLNDECRVAIEHNKLTAMRQAGVHTDSLSKPKRNTWSPNREMGWTAVRLDNQITDTDFIDGSFHNTFYKFGSVACPSNSPARSERIWDRSSVCTSCASPHSSGQFLSDWHLAADICHQPDLANLHGLYLSPAAFKASPELMPVFSQSKAHGYSDILYPSAWNYMDKVRYDPSPERPDDTFFSKKNTLFWRGATSEGVSAVGTWQGMTRQRLVHLANNLTSSDSVTLLLPSLPDSSKYAYRTLSGSEVPHLNLSMDIHVVDHIARCGLSDCPNQAAEFGLVGPSDFQDHWKYRYLFDLDGAGFSGRFLPFLQSHSLPFKSALFREWYDDRLQAWLHFVPQDLRLHAVYSTLAYFAGVDGVQGGKQVKMEAHVEQGEKIAEAGREWAGKVLRKEDMEIYFFRLLLEWGRLTDDRRDSVGFEMS